MSFFGVDLREECEKDWNFKNFVNEKYVHVRISGICLWKLVYDGNQTRLSYFEE